MICTRDETPWAPSVLSRLAKYTHDAAVHPGDAMDLGALAPQKSIQGLLFALPDIATPAFEVLGMPASIMLCVGITADELASCKLHNSDVVLRMLREQSIFPYTDLGRSSVTVV
jgi:hypothetical protein